MLHYFRLIHKPRLFTLTVFAILLALLIKKTYRKDNRYIIDTEYIGRNDEIKSRILLTSVKLQIPLRKDQMIFKQIGKRSLAHSTCYIAFKNPKNTKKINAATIISLLMP